MVYKGKTNFTYFFSIDNIRVSFLTVFYFISVVLTFLELLGSPRHPAYSVSYSVTLESEVVALFSSSFMLESGSRPTFLDAQDV